jgi:excinuclease ABC subunit C
MLIDGGKGQLNSVLEVIRRFELEEEIPLAALAKQEEELFIPGQTQSVRLPERSEGMYLVQRVRDEAHRFANEGHRKRRTKVGVASLLDDVPGVGPRRRKALLDQFGSLDGIRKATVEEVASVPGIPYEVANAVKARFD